MSHPTLSLDGLTSAVKSAVAIRMNIKLQPAVGEGGKLFPPTYVADDNRRHGETKYATEVRRIGGEDVLCVLLDSVASQANRMEAALLSAWETGQLSFPLLRVDFSGVDDQLEAPVGSISTLEAPHRIYDAIFRDSVDESGTLFRYTPVGQAVTNATPRDATALFLYCPTAMIFGSWDSTGPKGGLGSKFQRALSSEIIAVGVRTGTKVGGRLDPLGIVKKAGPVYESGDREKWLFEKPTGKTKELNPSDINHGNVAPSRDTQAGGVTCDYALQTTVLSLPALRRLRFRGAGSGRTPAAEGAAQTALAALALAALAGAHREGHDLRSGALLVGQGPPVLEVLDSVGAVSGTYTVNAEQAEALVAEAAARAAKHGLAWETEPVPALRPAEKLVELLSRSQSLEAREAPQAGDAS